jgi:hypothetical protein
VSDRIDRNDAIEIVGQAWFGDAWVGPGTVDELERKKKYRAWLLTGVKVPEQEWQGVYEAGERDARADRQHREVIQWLENFGFDCVRGLRQGFDRREFFKRLEAEFGIGQGFVAPQQRIRYATDASLVREAILGIKNKKYPNILKAAQDLALRAEGGSDRAKVDRLRKKIAKAL